MITKPIKVVQNHENHLLLSALLGGVKLTKNDPISIYFKSVKTPFVLRRFSTIYNAF